MPHGVSVLPISRAKLQSNAALSPVCWTKDVKVSERAKVSTRTKVFVRVDRVILAYSLIGKGFRLLRPW
jgi:hypothetical protein